MILLKHYTAAVVLPKHRVKEQQPSYSNTVYYAATTVFLLLKQITLQDHGIQTPLRGAADAEIKV